MRLSTTRRLSGCAPVYKPLKLKLMPEEVVNFEQGYVLIGPSMDLTHPPIGAFKGPRKISDE